MRILLCTNSFENIVNGPAKFANLILEINRLYPQHEIRILTEDVTQSHPKVHKVTLRIPRFLYVFSQLFRMFIYHRHAARLQKVFPYDVLVYNNAFIGLWSALVSRQPTVGMINDYNNLSIHLKDYRSDKYWFKKLLFKFFEQLSTKYHQLIITNSDNLTQQVTVTYGISTQKVKRLYKAVDVSMFQFDSDRIYAHPVSILFVKADYICGGLDVLAKALTIFTENQFVVHIIGPEVRFKESVLALFKMSHNVTVNFLGSQPQNMVAAYLQKSNLFCVPSRREALGVANIEALAAGIPVVTTQVGGIPEVMNFGNNGWLVPPENPAALANAIRECITNDAQRRQKSENGRKFVQKFSKEIMFAEFLRILENV